MIILSKSCYFGLNSYLKRQSYVFWERAAQKVRQFLDKNVRVESIFNKDKAAVLMKTESDIVFSDVFWTLFHEMYWISFMNIVRIYEDHLIHAHITKSEFLT